MSAVQPSPVLSPVNVPIVLSAVITATAFVAAFVNASAKLSRRLPSVPTSLLTRRQQKVRNLPSHDDAAVHRSLTPSSSPPPALTPSPSPPPSSSSDSSSDPPEMPSSSNVASVEQHAPSKVPILLPALVISTTKTSLKINK